MSEQTKNEAPERPSIPNILDVFGGPKRPFTPLFVLLGVIALVIYFAFDQLPNVEPNAQIAIIAFVAIFSCLTMGGYYYVVVRHPFNWFPPSEWAATPDPKKVVDAVRPRVVEETVTKTVSIEIPQTIEQEGTIGAEGEPPLLQLPAGVDDEPNSIEHEYIQALIGEPADLDKAERLHQQVLEMATDPVKRIGIQLFHLTMRLRNGDTTALAQLEALTKSDEVPSESVSDAWNALGSAYLTAGSFQRAEEAYTQAVATASNEADQVVATTNLAHCLSRLRRPEEAIRMIKDRIAMISDHSLLADLYDDLAQFYQELEEPLLQALALEKSLEHRPEDTGRRFNAARAYDAGDEDELSFLHYKRILQIETQNAAALNNIGVQYAELSLPALAVDSYRKAFELDETLSASNIAYLYMKAGFLLEAQNLLQEAMTKEDPHPNVSRAMAAISDQREEEEKSEEAILNFAREKQDFLLEYSNAAFASNPTSLSFTGSWLSGDGIAVAMDQNGEKLVAVWFSANREFTLKGTVHGLAAQIEGVSSKIPTNEWSYERTADAGFAYLSSDGQNAFLMTTIKRELTFMSLQRYSKEPVL